MCRNVGSRVRGWELAVRSTGDIQMSGKSEWE